MVGRTPWSATWSARVPLDPLFSGRIEAHASDEPARGPAADQGVRPTTCARVRYRENYAALGCQPAPQ